MSLIIRCDVGKEIGLGHYYRCTILKKAFEKNGKHAFLVLKYLDEGECPLPYDLLVEGSYKNEIAKYAFEGKNIILDMFHYKSRSDREFKKYIVDLQKNNNKIAFIEGLEDEACPSHFYPYLDVLITPYICSTLYKKHPNHFFGEDFLIMDVSRVVNKKNIKKIAKNILITFGGSDPWNQTNWVLNAFKKENCFNNVQIKVVIGPLMTKNQIKEIQQYEREFKEVHLLCAPQDLKDYFEWADLAITNSGNTRYELAASGVPCIIVPFNVMGHTLSKIFLELNVADLEQNFQNLDESVLVDHLFKNLNSYEKRLSMSNSGKKYFYKPTGTDNLIKNLIKVWQ